MIRQLLIIFAAACLPGLAVAQGTSIALGTGGFDSSQPVEVAADELRVDQSSGEAVFDGNVLVAQGEVRLTAGRVVVVYATDPNGTADGIDELRADGGVTFVTATDAVEAASAIYSVKASTVTLQGNVLLSQGQLALSGDRLVIDLESGAGRMEGRVRTVIGGSNN